MDYVNGLPASTFILCILADLNQWAIHKNQPQVCKFLLDAGASPTLEDGFGGSLGLYPVPRLTKADL